MQKLPFQTNETWLTDGQLILLDVIFDMKVSFRLLRHDTFRAQFNLGYSHNFNDQELLCHLRWLCEHGVLETDIQNNRRTFRMTPSGGELWSQERCPVWDRFCMERSTETLGGRTLMSVLAVSPEIRDDYLRLSLTVPARFRTATISNYCLIPWHPFPRLYVGLATYVEKREWTPEEYLVDRELQRERRALIQRERSWWQNVSQLQRFTPSTP